MSSLPSAKKKITGSDTHVADLTGTVTQTNSTGDNSLLNRTTTSLNVPTTGDSLSNSSGSVKTSIVITTPTNSLVVVSACCTVVRESGGFTGTIFVKLLDGSTELESPAEFAQTSEDNICETTFVGVPENGTRTYNVEVWNTTTLRYLTGISLRVVHIQLTDTHVATLNGSNTQDTHASNSLP